VYPLPASIAYHCDVDHAGEVSLTSFWIGVETGAPLAAPAWLRALSRAAVAELSFDVLGARDALAQADEPPGPFRRVADLIRLRIALRASDGFSSTSLRAEIETLVAALTVEERPTRARALHTLGVVALRQERLDDAAEALAQALAAAQEEPLSTWIADSFAQVFMQGGAWEEARRTILTVARRKEAVGDGLGVAITLGHLARLELRVGAPSSAAAAAEAALDRGGATLSILSRMRLHTFLLTARVEAADASAAARAADALEAVLVGAGSHPHPLKGYATLALARAAGARDDGAGVANWLAAAEPHLEGPEQIAMHRYWQAALVPDAADRCGFVAEMEGLFRAAGTATEAEVSTYLLLARRASRRPGEEAEMRRTLDAAFASATRANSALWIGRVDAACRELDPRLLARRLTERFTGRSEEELSRTARVDATVVFADLANFTPRSLDLPPEEVMATVRSLFELSLPLLARHKVQPISYLGDGLLAVAQGDDHARRGLRFARALVRRTAQVSAVRRFFGERWFLDLRAGVASGPVVLGVLGNLLKLEYTAIGPAVNLAARLQGQAAPGEVVASWESCAAAAPYEADGVEERLVLKGYPDEVRAARYSRSADLSTE
jgi:class 3 adenylate cyclase/tetratricopeptide (TPR) repeat protein